MKVVESGSFPPFTPRGVSANRLLLERSISRQTTFFVRTSTLRKRAQATLLEKKPSFLYFGARALTLHVFPVAPLLQSLHPCTIHVPELIQTAPLLLMPDCNFFGLLFISVPRGSICKG